MDHSPLTLISVFRVHIPDVVIFNICKKVFINDVTDEINT